MVNLADSVELPNRNETEDCQALQVTSLLPRFPSTGVLRSTRYPPVEISTYTTSQVSTWQGFCITTTSHLVEDAAL